MAQPSASEALRDELLVAMGDELGKVHHEPIEQVIVECQTAAVRFTNNRAGGEDRGKWITVILRGPDVRDAGYLSDATPTSFQVPGFARLSGWAGLILNYLFPESP